MLGVGLIGGSIGLAARTRAGAHVRGWDSDPDVRARALQLQALDEQAPDIAAAVAGVDVVFVATPVGALVPTARAALASAGERSVVSDVGSTKRAIAEAIADQRFVAGHPLAGSEVSGVEHARADLFDGAVWYLAPAADRQPLLEELIRTFGAQPVAIAPDLHDRLMATISHLPHVLANLLVAQASCALGEAPPGAVGTGPSFREATRVAGSNSAIWTDIYMSNRGPLIAAIDELTGRLAQIRAALDAGDAQAVREWNERARAERQTLLGQRS